MAFKPALLSAATVRSMSVAPAQQMMARGVADGSLFSRLAFFHCAAKAGASAVTSEDTESGSKCNVRMMPRDSAFLWVKWWTDFVGFVMRNSFKSFR